MLDDLKEEGIINRVGGRFKLCTLMQKRLVALNTGAPAMVTSRTGDRMQIVIDEILQGKISLDTEASTRAQNAMMPSPEGFADE